MQFTRNYGKCNKFNFGHVYLEVNVEIHVGYIQEATDYIALEPQRYRFGGH